jgi:hypothetical protein
MNTASSATRSKYATPPVRPQPRTRLAGELLAVVEWREALLKATRSTRIIARNLASITCLADLLGPPEVSLPAEHPGPSPGGSSMQASIREDAAHPMTERDPDASEVASLTSASRRP